jgi:hypothetical protein
VGDDDGCRQRSGPGKPFAKEEPRPRPERFFSDSTEAFERQAPALHEPELGRLRRCDREDRVERLVEHLGQIDGRCRRAPDGEKRRELGVLLVRARDQVGESPILIDDARFEILDEGEDDRREGEDAHGEERSQEQEPRGLVQPVVERRAQQEDEHQERREGQHDREPLQAREADDLRGHEPMTEPPEDRQPLLRLSAKCDPRRGRGIRPSYDPRCGKTARGRRTVRHHRAGGPGKGQLTVSHYTTTSSPGTRRSTGT